MNTLLIHKKGEKLFYVLISKDNDQWQGFENGDWEFIIDNSVLTTLS